MNPRKQLRITDAVREDEGIEKKKINCFKHKFLPHIIWRNVLAPFLRNELQVLLQFEAPTEKMPYQPNLEKNMSPQLFYLNLLYYFI